MTYATQSELITRFGEEELAQRTDRANGTAIDSDVVDRALADADAEINGYLGVRFALPLASVPPLLSRMAADIARYHLYDDGVPDTVRQRYEDATKLLQKMADGKVSLAEAEQLEQPAESAQAVSYRSDAKQFSASALASY